MKINHTLSLDKEVIEQAKIYAKETGLSLSQIVENYYRSLILESEIDGEYENKIDK
jgi:hypothetical protein